MELHFSSPSCVPFCAHSPAEANELQQGKDENSSAQRPPLGREAQITKINGQIPGNAPCGLCGLDLWGRLWTGPEMKQTADKAAPIPVKLQDVLPTQSWLSLHCTELFRCQLGMGAAECSNCSNLQMPAAREASWGHVRNGRRTHQQQPRISAWQSLCKLRSPVNEAFLD